MELVCWTPIGVAQPRRTHVIWNRPMLVDLVLWALLALCILYLFPTLTLDQFLTTSTVR
jgi:hypothetical protein